MLRILTGLVSACAEWRQSCCVHMSHIWENIHNSYSMMMFGVMNEWKGEERRLHQARETLYHKRKGGSEGIQQEWMKMKERRNSGRVKGVWLGCEGMPKPLKHCPHLCRQNHPMRAWYNGSGGWCTVEERRALCTTITCTHRVRLLMYLADLVHLVCHMRRTTVYFKVVTLKLEEHRNILLQCKSLTTPYEV